MVAWQRPNGLALLLRGGAATGLPGSHPALGGARIAWREGDDVTIADAATLRPARPAHRRRRRLARALRRRARLAHPRRRGDRPPLGRHRRRAAAGAGVAHPDRDRPPLRSPATSCSATPPARSAAACWASTSTTGAQTHLRAQPGAQITNPATDGTRLLYVHATGQVQQLRLGPLAPADPAADRVLLVHPSPGQRDREHEHGRHRHRQGYRGHAPAAAAARPARRRRHALDHGAERRHRVRHPAAGRQRGRAEHRHPRRARAPLTPLRVTRARCG